MAISNLALGVDITSITSIITYTLFVLVTSIASICALTWAGTTVRYHFTLWKFRQLSSKHKQSDEAADNQNNVTALSPPTLPYVLPWLGLALTFLNPDPGVFFRWLQHKLATTYISARSRTDEEGGGLRAVTLLLGGNRTHILTSPSTVQGLFKLRHLGRIRFNREIMTKAMGMSKEDDELAYGSKSGKIVDLNELQHENNAKFLLSTTAVNCLTNKFLEIFNEEIAAENFDEDETTGGWKVVNVTAWLKDKMLRASTTALMGRKIMEMNPDFCKQYWDFDSTLMHRFYGLPQLIYPNVYKALDKMMESMTRFTEYTREVFPDGPPDEPEWEPIMGAQVIRNRHHMFKQAGISVGGMASFDLGFLFGLASNAIPASSWMLLHLLSPTNSHILEKVQAELQTAVQADGSIDVSTMVSLTYFNAAFLETLRLYVDVLVTRETKTDVVIDGYLLKRDDIIIAPTYLGHRDPTLWNRAGMPPEEVWYPERFIRHEEETDTPIVSTTGTTGKFFPFGGGNQMCPGRVFAKQEILGAVAAVLLSFDIEFQEFVGKPKGSLPAGFPVVKKTFNGSGVVNIEGDLRVRLRRK